MKTTMNMNVVSELKGEVFQHLIGMYLESSLLKLERIELFISLDDENSLKKEVHSWALASGIIGADKLAALLMEIEFSATPVAEATALMDKCCQEFEVVERSLREIIGAS